MSNKAVAEERIKNLFREADEIFKDNPKLASRYVAIARKIAMKFNIKISKGLKRKFCKHCYSYLRPSVNCRIRTKEGKVVYFCMNCKKYMRFPLKKSR